MSLNIQKGSIIPFYNIIISISPFFSYIRMYRRKEESMIDYFQREKERIEKMNAEF